LAGHKIGKELDAKDDIFIFDLIKDKVFQFTNTMEEESDPAWSFDGSKIIFARAKPDYDEIVVKDLANYQEQVLYPRRQRIINPEISNPLLLQNNKDLLASFGLYFYLLKEKAIEPEPAYGLFAKTSRDKEWIEKLFIGEASFSYDFGKLIYTYFNNSSSMEIFDLKTGSISEFPGDCINGLAPDNEFYLYTTIRDENFIIYVQKIPSKQFEPSIRLFAGEDPAWSPWLNDKVLEKLK
jgi:Tol biopolymer transport system component